jgi:hypothetical protein
MIRSRRFVKVAISAAAALTDSCDMRSRETMPMGTSGYAWRMVLSTASSFDCVRDASKRREGDCDAMLSAMDEPIDSGETPVIRTVIEVSGRQLARLFLDIPFLPCILSAKAFATSRPPVSLSHSGWVNFVEAMLMDKGHQYLIFACFHYFVSRERDKLAPLPSIDICILACSDLVCILQQRSASV